MRIASLFLFAVGVCLAQTGTGSIQGTVRDASGAVVPKANVTVVHTATTREYTSVTNEAGFYLIPALQSGGYQISVGSPGMETWKGELNLVAGQSAAVETVLKPGSTVTSVTVATRARRPCDWLLAQASRTSSATPPIDDSRQRASPATSWPACARRISSRIRNTSWG